MIPSAVLQMEKLHACHIIYMLYGLHILNASIVILLLYICVSLIQ